MKFQRAVAVLLALLASVACTPHSGTSSAPRTQGSTTSADVRNIILLIADGGGVGLWTAASYASDNLAVKRMPVVGLVDTRSASHKVTDSGAGATVYATGQRVTNRTISVGPASACPLPRSSDTTRVWPTGCERLDSWFRIARDRGKATGVVTTTSVVDATPAAMVAHSPSRYWYDEIAEQFSTAGLDVLFGGGRRYFAESTRRDRRDLLSGMCARAVCLSTAAELETYRADERPVVGLFADADMDALGVRPVALPAMVEAALAKLGRHPAGFVALFESEATDNSTHANMPLERITADILEFDRAVSVALDFAQRTPGTLVIVTGDHDTGGVSLAETGQDFALRYTTTGHTAGLVPLFAFGPGAEAFGGFRSNQEIGEALLRIVRAGPQSARPRR